MESSTQKHILIVEDEKSLSRAIDIKLTNAGFGVTVVNGGKEALTITQEYEFALIMLDLMMPEVDGFNVLEQLQKRGNQTPILIATNLDQQSDIDEALRLGATDYIVKSQFSLEKIEEKVIEMLAAV